MYAAAVAAADAAASSAEVPGGGDDPPVKTEAIGPGREATVYGFEWVGMPHGPDAGIVLR